MQSRLIRSAQQLLHAAPHEVGRRTGLARRGYQITIFDALPITGPVAALLLLLALAVKLSRRVDDDATAYRLATVLLVVGATLYYAAQVFAIEAASQSHLAGFGKAFTSYAHPTAALWVMWLALAGVVIVAGWLFVRVLRAANRTMARPAATSRTQAPAARTGPSAHTPVAP